MTVINLNYFIYFAYVVQNNTKKILVVGSKYCAIFQSGEGLLLKSTFRIIFDFKYPPLVENMQQFKL